MEDGLGVCRPYDQRGIIHKVLILVLVEDGLGEIDLAGNPLRDPTVLILVLVEDGLGALQKTYGFPIMMKVLILVLVEDGLGG